MVELIQKRDGRQIPFVREKITRAIYLAASVVAKESKEEPNYEESERLTDQVVAYLMNNYKREVPSVEQVQDAVVNVLIQNGHTKTSEAYILYRNERNRIRSLRSRLMQSIEAITYADDLSVLDDRVTMDVTTPIGTLMQYGSTISKEFCLTHVINPKFGKLHESGEIYIHDLDFMNMGTLTSCHLDLNLLFQSGFSSGHAYVREPQDIASYVALCVIALQSNQNDQHGAQSIPAFDHYFAKGVAKTFRKKYIMNVNKALMLYLKQEIDVKSDILELEKETKHNIALTMNYELTDAMIASFQSRYHIKEDDLAYLLDFAYREARNESDYETYQAMEAMLHSLNVIHSQTGSRIPYTSINFGSDVSVEGRMLMKNLLLALSDGLGNGETPMFPIFNFKLKQGVNLNPKDPNYDLFQLSLKVQAKRQCIYFIFLDAPFNLKHYKENDLSSEVAIVGSNTRVMDNCVGKTTPISRGNNSFTTINLVRLALNCTLNAQDEQINEEVFFHELDQQVEVVWNQLLERKALQESKRVRNFPFLMGQGIWIRSEELDWNDTLESAVAQGTFSVGYIGLAECLILLKGAHHGESEESQALGLKIVGRMHDLCEQASERYHLNIGVIATSTKGLGRHFLEMDQKQFGYRKEIHANAYYSDAAHLPQNFECSLKDKLRLEAPYHALSTNGHVATIWLQEENNLQKQMETCINLMKHQGIGYATIKVKDKRT